MIADLGADVNAVDTEGKTPLHEAILQGNSNIVEFLLKNGANVHYKTKYTISLLLMFLNENLSTLFHININIA